jgi:hypothetical protein
MGLNDPHDTGQTSDPMTLWDDTDPVRPTPAKPRPAPAPDAESFDLVETDTSLIARSVSPLPSDESTSKHARSVPDRSGRLAAARPFPLWSRARESGPAAVASSVVALSALILAWIFSDWNTIHIAGWICLIGAAATILTAYPLVVGLERPVRMSPERTVKDFFESLEHHSPLYRRMWLFLTPEAQNSRHYAEFSGFRAYWQGRVREWRHRGDSWPGTPVVVTIENLKPSHDPSDPLVRHLRFSIGVSLRGRRSAGPVARYDLNWSAERGRDGQWYLRQADPPE